MSRFFASAAHDAAAAACGCCAPLSRRLFLGGAASVAGSMSLPAAALAMSMTV